MSGFSVFNAIAQPRVSTRRQGEADCGVRAGAADEYSGAFCSGAGNRPDDAGRRSRGQDWRPATTMTVDAYQSVNRSLKYVLLFEGLVFLTYFTFEVTSGKRVHPAQYVLVGVAQIIFYLLLLSLSEKVGFDVGFLIAGAATVGLLSVNANWIFRSRSLGLRALAVFCPLYGLIYVLLRLKDYALLVGAVASFVAVATGDVPDAQDRLVRFAAGKVRAQGKGPVVDGEGGRRRRREARARQELVTRMGASKEDACWRRQEDCTWQSSWTETDAGRRGAVCRAWRASRRNHGGAAALWNMPTRSGFVA